MKLILILTAVVLLLTSCSHLHKVNSTSSKNIIEVQLADAKHRPQIGQSVKVFEWILKSANKRSMNLEPKGWVREREIEGKVVRVVSDDLIIVELETDYNVTQNTRAE